MDRKKISFKLAIIPVLFLIVSLFLTLQYWGGDPQIPIIASTIVAVLIAMLTGYSWNELREGIIETIEMSMGSILILAIIGMIIGTWILSGVVPTMIYYGLQILSPSFFLIATALICSVVSIATGSSWTTAGTVGIALIGIGQGLDIPLPVVAGAIISGSYFGDKMSPLSDTTNLAPAMAGSNLFEHIKHMLYTTAPSYIIALIIYGILGIKYANSTINTESINVILNGLTSQFTISPFLLLPPLLVIIMVFLKVPAIPGLIGGTILGGIFAFIFQGAGMTEIIKAAHYGFSSDTGVEAVDSLLNNGGLNNMMWTISLILCAMAFGGILEKSGMLVAIAEKILALANSTGSLILATILTCIATNILAGDQYLAIVIPGRMYKKIYDDKGLHPKNLSRTLEDGGTITSCLIPWNSGGAYMYTTLGVHPFAYAPYAFFNIINPVIAVLLGYSGFSIEKIEKES
ncbi:Na+/H+ antiporter NhaC [Dethiothermospora halolimnae]|uniref:Na+/H+ antiporter NhaC n=1 Tax=Dethiothermospora halolimnae TaxID=3114390 RepID=UPI003CCBB44E